MTKNFTENILELLKPHFLVVTFCFFITVLLSLSGLILPKYVGEVIDTMNLSRIDLSFVSSQPFLILVGLTVIQAILSVVRGLFTAKIGIDVERSLRHRLFNQLLYFPVCFFDENKSGNLSSRITNDANAIRVLCSDHLIQLVELSISLLGTLIILALINVKLALIIFLLIPFYVISINWLGKKIHKQSRDYYDYVADANVMIEEALYGIRVVKSFVTEKYEMQRYEKILSSGVLIANRLVTLDAIMRPIALFLSTVSMAAIFLLGVYLLSKQEISVGTLASIQIYSAFLTNIITGFMFLYSQTQGSLGTLDYVFSLLSQKSSQNENKDDVKIEKIIEKISFNNVSFRYRDFDQKNLLNNICFSADVGDIVAIVGLSGAGKSTLVSLISRFYEVSDGEIMIDNVNIRRFSLQDLRSRIGIVSQDTYLFSGSIFENIHYGSSDSSDSDVFDAAKIANAHIFIENLPNKYNTIIGERGIKLSGGQRQRLAIARAVLKNPQILILDEATSSLDSESEFLVQEALERVMENRTTFVIAHRLSTIQRASRILVLENGSIAQSGTHESLIAEDGLYKTLYGIQFLQNRLA